MDNLLKIAKNKYPVIDIIKNRWSPRSFTERLIAKNLINSILEAARWSPSSFNEQPWRYILGFKNKGDNFSKIFDALHGFNKKWTINAPLLMVCCCKRNFSHNNMPNVHAAYDSGQSIAYLTMQAMSENIYVHQMAGFDKTILKNNLNISDDFDICTVIALGYLGSPDILPIDLKKLETSERERKSINELLL